MRHWAYTHALFAFFFTYAYQYPVFASTDIFLFELSLEISSFDDTYTSPVWQAFPKSWQKTGLPFTIVLSHVPLSLFSPILTVPSRPIFTKDALPVAACTFFVDCGNTVIDITIASIIATILFILFINWNSPFKKKKTAKTDDLLPFIYFTIYLKFAMQTPDFPCYYFGCSESIAAGMGKRILWWRTVLLFFETQR